MPRVSTSRYAITSATFLTSLALLAWPIAERIELKIGAILSLAAATILAALVPVSALNQIRQGQSLHEAELRSQTSLVVGLSRPGYLAVMGTNTLVPQATTFFRAHKKSLFGDQWSRSLGQQLDTTHTTMTCAGDIEVAPTFSDAPEFASVAGAVDASMARAGRIVVIIDAQQIVAGYGLVTRAARDLLPFGYEPGARIQWVGTAKTAARPYTAYLASPQRLLCRIGAS